MISGAKRRLQGRYVVIAFLLISLVLPAAAQNSATPPASPPETLIVFLHDGGFSPSTLTVRAGRILIVFKNRSRASTVTLSLTRPSDAYVAVAAEDVQSVARDYPLTLTTGTYRLTDSAHPNWKSLTITVE